MGHAGSDVEIAYRSQAAIQADYLRDPLLGTARALVESGHWTAEDVLARYEEVRNRVRTLSVEVGAEPQLASRDAVMAPLAHPRPRTPARPLPPDPKPLTLAQAINQTLADELAEHDDVLVFGEDVAVKGGVYGVTRGLRDRFGADPGLRHPARRADRPRHRAGHRPRRVRAGARDPVPRLPAQRRGPAPRRGRVAAVLLRRAVRQRHGRPDRRAGLPEGLRRPLPQRQLARRAARHPGHRRRRRQPPAQRARRCCAAASTWLAEGRVCVYVEPIARYHTRDLFEGDAGWLAPFDGSTRAALGEVVGYGTGRDLLLMTFGNGVFMSLRVAAALRADGFGCTVLDLAWVAPLPVAALVEAAHRARRGPGGGRDPAQRRGLRGRGRGAGGRRGRGARSRG